MGFISKLIKYTFIGALYIILFVITAYAAWFFFPYRLLIDYSHLDQRTTPSPTDIELDRIVRHEFIETAPNIKLHVNIAGDSKNEPIIFMHGFPESGTASWKHQIVYFANKGYFVIAPDMRGYNTSSKPVGIENYVRSKLVNDVLKIKQHYAGDKPVKLVAHDWGGVILWAFLTIHPSHVERAVVINLPAPPTFQNDLPLIQLANSYYIYLFQTPYWILKHKVEGEEWLTYFGVSSFTNKTSLYDLNELKKKWLIPGELEATINWYKASLQLQDPDVPERGNFKVTSPVKVIWGNQDKFLDVRLGRASLKYVDNEHKKYVELNGTHWIPREMPDEVNKEIEEWFNEKF